MRRVLVAEKLLLQVLIVLTPGFLMSLFYNGKRMSNSSTWFLAILHSTVALICMSVSYFEFQVPWDFRYIPLILSFLYGGARVGWVVTAVLVGFNFFYAFDLATILTSIVIAVVSHIMSMKYQFSRSRITKIAILLALAFFSLFLKFLSIADELFISLESTAMILLMNHMVFYFIAFILTTLFSMLLYELINEKNRILGEIIQKERQNTVAELAASIAHEVRNPLTVVKGFLQLMREDSKRENEVEYYNLALSELERAEYIVTDYLDFAKPKLNKIEVVSVTKCIQEVVSLLTPLALKENVELLAIYTENIDIKTDRYQFKQVLINFIKNSIEAINGEGKINIKVHQSKGLAYIKISDNGKGMSQEQLKQVGTVYYTTKKEGTGLGTMVSFQLIKQMGGKVTFYSREGVGTDVQISLPLYMNGRTVGAWRVTP
ncbi:sensor histidine kinase [Alkalihalobacillus alcalophilus]|uniref:sensor histidine kinase n=1 Tax=Alkalihalobacillus alcalophilus TaxID=1445 RepID=UPI00136203D6|nr:HAMP domain-containing sensor histidine kinase [Alkalihalobacillus alcalophilus]